MENTSSVIDTTGTELPQYITTLEELVNTQGAILQQENTDKTLLLSVLQPNGEILRARLIIWASLGFPEYWKALSVQINPPYTCCDGERRQVWQYVGYLLDGQTDILLNTLNAQVPGMKFSFFISDVNTVGISVIKS